MMTPSPRTRVNRASINARSLATRSTGVTQPRQSPITDIRTLTRLVFKSYQESYSHSSPKVQQRYRRLICELSYHAKPRNGGY